MVKIEKVASIYLLGLVSWVSGQNPPRQKPPGHKPPDKSPLDKNPPRENL